MSAAHTAADQLMHSNDGYALEGQSIEIEESEYPSMFTDKKGLAMISFVIIGLSYGLNQVYPYLYQNKKIELISNLSNSTSANAFVANNTEKEDGIIVSLIETSLTFMQWALETIKSTDRRTAFLYFIGFLLLNFGLMIYTYGHFIGGMKKRKRTRKIKK
jgi:hypothetical protein